MSNTAVNTNSQGASTSDKDAVIDRLKALHTTAKAYKPGKVNANAGSFVQESVTLVSSMSTVPEVAQAAGRVWLELLSAYPPAITLLRLEGVAGVGAQLMAVHFGSKAVMLPIIRVLTTLLSASGPAVTAFLKEDGMTALTRCLLCHAAEPQLAKLLSEMMLKVVLVEKGSRQLMKLEVVSAIRHAVVGSKGNWQVIGTLVKVVKVVAKRAGLRPVLAGNRELLDMLMGLARMLVDQPERTKILKRVSRTLWLLCNQLLPPLPPPEPRWQIPTRDPAAYVDVQTMQEAGPWRANELFPESTASISSSAEIERPPGPSDPAHQVQQVRMPAPLSWSPPSAMTSRSRMEHGRGQGIEEYHSDGHNLQSTMMMHDLTRILQPVSLLNRPVYINHNLHSSDPWEDQGPCPGMQSGAGNDGPSSLSFESCFESGNLRAAVHVRDQEYDLFLSPDINDRTEGCHLVQWFYFAVWGATPGEKHKFNIVNFRKKSSLFNEGSRPLVCYVGHEGNPEDEGGKNLVKGRGSCEEAVPTQIHQGEAPTDFSKRLANGIPPNGNVPLKEGTDFRGGRDKGDLACGPSTSSPFSRSSASGLWTRAGTRVCYYASPYRASLGSSIECKPRKLSGKGSRNRGRSKSDEATTGPGLWCLTFSLSFPTSGVYLIASCYPYTYTDLQDYLSSFIARALVRPSLDTPPSDDVSATLYEEDPSGECREDWVDQARYDLQSRYAEDNSNSDSAEMPAEQDDDGYELSERTLAADEAGSSVRKSGDLKTTVSLDELSENQERELSFRRASADDRQGALVLETGKLPSSSSGMLTGAGKSYQDRDGNRRSASRDGRDYTTVPEAGNSPSPSSSRPKGSSRNGRGHLPGKGPSSSESPRSGRRTGSDRNGRDHSPSKRSPKAGSPRSSRPTGSGRSGREHAPGKRPTSSESLRSSSSRGAQQASEMGLSRQTNMTKQSSDVRKGSGGSQKSIQGAWCDEMGAAGMQTAGGDNTEWEGQDAGMPLGPAPPCVFRSFFCHSLAQRRVELLTITGPGDASAREVVMMTGRVHPGETAASWVVQGFLEFLVSPEPTAELLRSLFVFKVIPMLNPDGVAEGNYRCSLAGCDLNRVWEVPQRALHPPVFHARALAAHLAAEGRLALFIDVHGHSNKPDTFFYGCEPGPPPSSASAAAASTSTSAAIPIATVPPSPLPLHSAASAPNSTSQATSTSQSASPLPVSAPTSRSAAAVASTAPAPATRVAPSGRTSPMAGGSRSEEGAKVSGLSARAILRLRVRALPYLASCILQDFNFARCDFKVRRAKAGAARVVVCRSLGVGGAYTLEASLGGRSGGRGHFSLMDYLRQGTCLGRAIARLVLIDDMSLLEEMAHVVALSKNSNANSSA